MQFRMLSRFEALFRGKAYLHRRSNQGDQLSIELYEDLYALGRSPKFVASIDQSRRGLNVRNTRVGIQARRGDGTFGEFAPGQDVIRVDGYSVARGLVATLDIGIEAKILNKAMIKQINDRIAGLLQQAEYFVTGRDGRRRGNPISVAIVAANYADYTIGYEGERVWRTDGRDHPHPRAVQR